MDVSVNEDVLSLVIFVVCLVMSAFFSASETAVTSLGVLRTKHLIEGEIAGSNQLKFWLRYPSRVLTTILIFNTLVNILASAVITALASRYFDHAIGIATGSVTFLVLIFGEILPKSFARANSEKLAAFALKFIKMAYFLSYPIVIGLSEFANFVIRLLGSSHSLAPSLTEEELEFLVNEGGDSGVLEEFKKKMLSGVFEFDETKVGEIMTPRTDVVAIAKTDTLDDVLKASIESGHSRIPIFDERIDNIVGIMFAKDMLRHLGTNGKLDSKITTLMREPFFTPESKPIIDVFKDLQRTKNHMTIVIDEYGGMAGLVTMEDIIEEIVGDIQDEFDVEEDDVIEVEEDIFDVAGTMSIDEFTEKFHLEGEINKDELEDVDTVAGWVIQNIGELPKVGQTINTNSLTVQVSEVDRHRIERVRVVKKPGAPEIEGSV